MTRGWEEKVTRFGGAPGFTSDAHGASSRGPRHSSNGAAALPRCWLISRSRSRRTARLAGGAGLERSSRRSRGAPAAGAQAAVRHEVVPAGRPCPFTEQATAPRFTTNCGPAPDGGWAAETFTGAGTVPRARRRRPSRLYHDGLSNRLRRTVDRNHDRPSTPTPVAARTRCVPVGVRRTTDVRHAARSASPARRRQGGDTRLAWWHVGQFRANERSVNVPSRFSQRSAETSS